MGTHVYVEDPWDVDSYATKLKTLYRGMHGLKRTSPVDNAKVQQYSEWLVPKVDEIYLYLREKYTNVSVLSSMMLPVASVLRKELGEDHAITTKWREEATELRYHADEEASHLDQGADGQGAITYHPVLAMVCPVLVHHATTATSRLGNVVHH